MIKSAAGIIAVKSEKTGDEKSILLDVERSTQGIYVKITETQWPAMVQRSLVFGE